MFSHFLHFLSFLGIDISIVLIEPELALIPMIHTELKNRERDKWSSRGRYHREESDRIRFNRTGERKEAKRGDSRNNSGTIS